MHSRFVGVACLFALTMVSFAQADTIIYFSEAGDAAAPGVWHGERNPGETGQLGLYVKTDEGVAGVSLDVTAVGDSIRLTGAEVPNPAAPAPALGRWFQGLVSNGVVASDGKSITNIEGAALVGLAAGGTGLEGVPDGPNPGYLFATINYEVTGVGSTDIILETGRNSFGPITSPLTVYFGGNLEDPVSQQPGGVSGAADAILVGIPEPSALVLACLACVGLAFRRRK